jgi:hypothetical protein
LYYLSSSFVGLTLQSDPNKPSWPIINKNEPAKISIVARNRRPIALCCYRNHGGSVHGQQMCALNCG